MTRKIDYNGIEMVAILSQSEREKMRESEKENIFGKWPRPKVSILPTIKNSIN